MREPGRQNPPWLFGFANFLLSGNGLNAALPFILRQAGMSVPDIAGTTALLLIPSFSFFLWTPVVEVGLARRHWFMLLNAIFAGFQILAFLQPLPAHRTAFTVLYFIANIAGFGQIGIFGPLVRDTVPEEKRGEAAGWMVAGGLLSAVGAGLFVWVSEHYGRSGLSLTVAAAALIPVLTMWRIHEPPRPPQPGLGEQLRAVGRDLKAGFRTRSVKEGLVIFASPMSSVPMIYLFSGIATDYHVSAGSTAFLSGTGWSLASAAGALAGGRLVTRIGPRYAYPLSGIAAGLAAAAMTLGALTPGNYTVWSMVYVCLAGFCGAGFLALTIELTAGAGHAASTWFAALWAMANLPITYMQWVDGQGYRMFGPRGMLGFDALGNAIPAVFFLFYLRLRRSPK